MYMRQRWRDSRLANSTLGNRSLLITHGLHRLWVPDLFIKNDKVSTKSDVTTPNVFVRVDNDGNIVYSQRVSSLVACSMQLSRYPFDEQQCSLQMESCEWLTYFHCVASCAARPMLRVICCIASHRAGNSGGETLLSLTLCGNFRLRVTMT